MGASSMDGFLCRRWVKRSGLIVTATCTVGVPVNPSMNAWMHNAGMDRIFLALCAVLVLAACQPQVPPPPAAPALPPPAAFDLDAERQLVWQARLPCADCDAIDTTLSLQREGDAARYELREAFVDGARGEQYAESGEWSRDGVLVRLHADGGGLRVYAIERDGRLSPRGRDGQRLERGDARFLAPVTP
jgi:hypothetical protein